MLPLTCQNSLLSLIDQLDLQLSKLLLVCQIGFELLLQLQIRKVDCHFALFLDHCCWLPDQKQVVQPVLSGSLFAPHRHLLLDARLLTSLSCKYSARDPNGLPDSLAHPLLPYPAD